MTSLRGAERAGHSLIQTRAWLATIAAWLVIAAAHAAEPSRGVMSLAGDWRFALDPDGAGRQGRWFETVLPDTIFLPGTTDLAGYGTRTCGVGLDAFGFPGLSRTWFFEGMAWYQKDIVVPEAWRGTSLRLFLERCHWQSTLWFDGVEVGENDSLSAPHVYDLPTDVQPGPHRITLCVDNSYRIDIGRLANAISEGTQTNWNGIVGRVELHALPPVRVERLRVEWSFERNAAVVRADLANTLDASASGVLHLALNAPGEAAPSGVAEVEVTGLAGLQAYTAEIPLKDPRLWDEWSPNLYAMSASFEGHAADVPFADSKTIPVGLRILGTQGLSILLNGSPVYLRGTLDCAAFPLTGHPPADAPAWELLLGQVREYGLNHVRFNGWCPPEAAFAVADRLGLILQIELPVATSYVPAENASLDAFMHREADRILEAYGHHPSFAILALGNQLEGDWASMDAFVAELKAKDPSRLYTFTSDHARMEPGLTSDVFVGLGSQAGRFRRYLSHAGGDYPQPHTDHDLQAHFGPIATPTIFHELGQWAVYPDYAQIARYTGTLKPRNLEEYRGTLVKNGLLGQAEAFHRASGAFAWRLWKEDIETVLRTSDMSGFQLYQLHDWPGLGEVHVGLLDALRVSKGILTPEAFRAFAGETVPLVRIPRFVWATGDTLECDVVVAHHGSHPLRHSVVHWTLRDAGRDVALTGSFPPTDLQIGLTSVGKLQVSLAQFGALAQLSLDVRIDGTPYHNAWDLWVYPDETLPVPESVVITQDVAHALQALREGRRVLYSMRADATPLHALPSRFLPVSKSAKVFGAQPTTMGILCDPSHPAFAAFPTRSHTDWQWWDVLRGPSHCFVLDAVPAELTPLVWAIDDFHTNRRLAYAFEARVGEGALLACAIDLDGGLEERPATRQFRASLLTYMTSEAFQPHTILAEGEIPGVLE